MKFLRWTDWSIGTRLVWITFVPVAVLFCTIVSFTYFARLAEVRAEVIERGKVVATALAESSEYSLVTGNFSELERISKGFLKADGSIREIRVLDTQNRTVFRIASAAPADASIPVAASAVVKQVLTVADFGATGEPHLTSAIGDSSTTIKPSVIGRALVSMSAVDVLAVQKRRLYLQTAIALLALLGSIFVAYVLSTTLKRPLAMIIEAVNSIRAGRYDVDVAVTSGGEIGDLQTSIKEMSISLNESKQGLERKVQERTIALEQSRNEAVKANYEKRKLIQKVNTAVEDERKSISIEIHDQLNATLIAAKLNSERILHLAQLEPSEAASSEIGARAQTIMNLTLELYENARIIVRRLRPEVLDMLGLRGAIEEMILTYNASHPSCHFEFRENGDCSKLEGGLSITIFRLIQEGLSNVVKHAEASQAYVTLKVDEPGKTVRLVVLDNGVGCNVSAEGEGIGLIGMKERVFPYNGSFQFESQPGQGTKITICLPLMHEPQDPSEDR
jgi:two-component system sensor histidine kinase UhpB